LKKEFPNDDKILNICDMPIDIMLGYADYLKMDVWERVPEYFGLNHFGWFTKIFDKKGNDLTDKLKSKMLDDGYIPIDEKNAGDESWEKTYRQANQIFRDFPEFLPNTYLQYYLYPDDVIKNERMENTRARQVMNGREKNASQMCQQIISQQSLENIHLKAGIHGINIVKIATCLVHNLNEVFIVMVENNGIISNIPDEAIVEVSALLTSHGPKPFLVGEIPTFYKGLIENQFAYEKLVVEAYFENNYLKALQALTLNRTIIHVPKAKAILDDLIEANKDYWPLLK
jgi:maltose-6'-phosphate glucosidase